MESGGGRGGAKDKLKKTKKTKMFRHKEEGAIGHEILHCLYSPAKSKKLKKSKRIRPKEEGVIGPEI